MATDSPLLLLSAIAGGSIGAAALSPPSTSPSCASDNAASAIPPIVFEIDTDLYNIWHVLLLCRPPVGHGPANGQRRPRLVHREHVKMEEIRVSERVKTFIAILLMLLLLVFHNNDRVQRRD
ncbi:hypothetical protein L2E82_06031 [Cichorium intybus]|uniref:Uncharacterized protein n=1 Tax=Cichorium intybus TaxID=13427 RepID=A0ACB9HA40_CICIN|nr:hypothetical protein L2E82_06031 [Cichorium intybus]